MHGLQGDWGEGWYRLEGDALPPGATFELLLDAEPDDTVACRIRNAGQVRRDGRLRSIVRLDRRVQRMVVESNRPYCHDRLRLRRIRPTQALAEMVFRAEPGARGGLALAVAAFTRISSLAGFAMSMGLPGAWRLFAKRHGHHAAGSARSLTAAKVTSNPVAWPFPLPFDLYTLQQLVGAGDAWEATGNDPAFELGVVGEPVPLPAGWYRLRAELRPSGGHPSGAVLYPDYGAGYVEKEAIPLPEPREDGRIDSVVLLKFQVRALRFDPCARRVEFTLREFEVSRLSRAGALFRMLYGAGSGSWRTVLGLVVDGIKMAFRDGFARAVEQLYGRQLGRHAAQMPGRTYADWVRSYDTVGRRQLQEFAQRVGRLSQPPLISIILPVYRTPERWLRRCIESVLAQAYPHWELCIADDASPDLHVRRVLEGYASQDERIRIVWRQENGHIAEASNSALALARGEFVALLDHDDELRPHSMLEFAEAIAADPGRGLIYSDEDKIDAAGNRFAPNFKPDWNYDLLLSQNYICHLTVIRTDIVRDVGGFRRGFEGSQDHDLILRCCERLSPERIYHIPKVLYHWRAIEGSTALERDAKDYAAEAGARAVDEHLRRCGQQARVELLEHGHYRVRRALPTPAPHVSIIIPTRDKVNLLSACVESILARTEYPNYDILVVDNRSEDDQAIAYLRQICQHRRVRVLRYDHEFNYAAINNWAVRRTTGELLCFLNNDIEVISPDWLVEMGANAIRPDVGAVGAMLYYPEGAIQHAGVILGIGGVANHSFLGQLSGSPGFCARALVTQNLTAVTGACMMLRREAFQTVKGFDERLAVAFNDVDLCLRLVRSGYANVWTPFAQLYHHESASRGKEDTSAKQARFEAEVAFMNDRWGNILRADPAYNVNLTLENTDFGFAFPPRG